MANHYTDNWRDTEDSLLIDVPEEFNFAVNLGYLARDKQECMFEVNHDHVTRIIVGDGQTTLVQISGNNDEPLHVNFLAGTRPDAKESRAAVVEYIREWFDLDRDLTPFYHIAQHDSLLEPLIHEFYGLRIIGINDLFEALCWGILGQQINLPFAYRLKREFVEAFGESITYNGKRYWIFPTYEKISRLTPEDMSDIKMTVRKREYIIGIAQKMATGVLSKEKLLQHHDFKKIEKELISIRGIGPWTANYCLMRCLRYPSAFPVADVGLMNAIKYFQQMDRKPTKPELLSLAAPWKGWEAYATFYLWRGFSSHAK